MRRQDGTLCHEPASSNILNILTQLMAGMADLARGKSQPRSTRIHTEKYRSVKLRALRG